MRMGIVGLLVLVLLVGLAGCAPKMVCSAPNVIINNECCLDADDDGLCDDPKVEAPKKVVEPVVVADEPEVEYTAVEETEEPQIVTYEKVETEQAFIPSLQVGKSKIGLGEPKKYIQINELSAFRTSRDEGMMDYMLYTVRNIGQKPIRPQVDLTFEYGRSSGNSGDIESRVIKEYKIEELEPGEKVVINQSLGIFFNGINVTKKIKMKIYNPFDSPDRTLEELDRSFTPYKLFPDMETHTYGKD